MGWDNDFLPRQVSKSSQWGKIPKNQDIVAVPAFQAWPILSSIFSHPLCGKAWNNWATDLRKFQVTKPDPLSVCNSLQPYFNWTCERHGKTPTSQEGKLEERGRPPGTFHSAMSNCQTISVPKHQNEYIAFNQFKFRTQFNTQTCKHDSMRQWCGSMWKVEVCAEEDLLRDEVSYTPQHLHDSIAFISKQLKPLLKFFWMRVSTSFWVNYNISLTWIKAIRGWFPLLTMIPGFGRTVRSL